jgi:hypothetical protein
MRATLFFPGTTAAISIFCAHNAFFFSTIDTPVRAEC